MSFLSLPYAYFDCKSWKHMWAKICKYLTTLIFRILQNISRYKYKSLDYVSLLKNTLGQNYEFCINFKVEQIHVAMQS